MGAAVTERSDINRRRAQTDREATAYRYNPPQRYL